MKKTTTFALVLLTGSASLAFEFPKPGNNAQPGDLAIAQTNLASRATTLGTLTVPENWDKPTKLIHLPLVVFHAQAQKPKEPIFIFHGGPGLSNLQTQHDYSWALEKHDVVLLGYRGVDGSVNLAMPEITAFQKEVPDPLTTAALRECAQVFDKAAARLEGAGITIAEYNLDGVVADVEAARKALGYSKILVSGGSYGGAVACYYSLCYSKNVKGCALIEAAFPWNFGLTEPANIDAQLRRLNEEWKSKPENLALSKDIQFSISNVLARLPKEHNGVLIDPGTLRLGIFFGLYTKQQTEMILRAIAAAERGDYSHLAMADGIWAKVVDIFNWGDLMIKTMSSKTGPPRDFVKELSPPDSIIGSPLALLGYGCFQFSAVKTKPMKHAQMERISVPTVLVYGSHETAEGAKSQMRFFPQGRLQVLGNLGHMDVYEDANRLQKSFFE